MVGQSVSHFRILEQLGAGGMGVVFKAEDQRLSRLVAIKFLPQAPILDPVAAGRFRREARAASALNHPNICTIYDIGESESGPFIVMELLEGQTLDARIAGRPLDPRQVIRIGAQIADALDAAHSRGILHRDIKPSNIFITPTGQAKVLDFGLAKMEESPGARQHEETLSMSPDVTTPGTTVGTIAYMSPEQARGEELDARSDIFSLGAVLYQMATGLPAFRGTTPAVIFSKILTDIPERPSRVNPQIPAALDRVILRAIEKDRKDRYQSASELRRDLEATVETRPQRRDMRSLVASIAGVLLLLLAGLFIWSRRPTPARAMRIDRVSNSGMARGPAISPDGKYIAYPESESGKTRILLHQTIGGGTAEILPALAASIVSVAFLPDANQIAYTITNRETVTSDVFAIPVLGGISRRLTTQAFGTPAFSPDGSRMTFTRVSIKPTPTYSLVEARIDGSGEQELYSAKAPVRLGFSSSWSPDGKWIACLEGERILLLPADGGSPKTLGNYGWHSLESVVWLPAGDGLLVTSEQPKEFSAHHQVYRVSYPSGDVRRITSDLNDYHYLSISRNNDVVSLQLSGQRGIWLVPLSNPDGSRPITNGRDNGTFGVAWIGDGRVVESDADGVAWVMAPDGSGRRQLAADQDHRVLPVRCGPTHIAYSTSNSGASHVWVSSIDGTDAHIVGSKAGDNHPSCTPDGKWVYYTTDNDLAIAKVPIEGGTSTAVITQAHDPYISPDGKWIVFHSMSLANHVEHIAVAPVDTPSLLRTLPLPVTDAFGWAADSRSVLFVNRQPGADNIYSFPLTGADSIPLTRFTSDRITRFDASPDGKSLMVTRSRSFNDVVMIRDW